MKGRVGSILAKEFLHKSTAWRSRSISLSRILHGQGWKRFKGQYILVGRDRVPGIPGILGLGVFTGKKLPEYREQSLFPEYGGINVRLGSREFFSLWENCELQLFPEYIWYKHGIGKYIWIVILFDKKSTCEFYQGCEKPESHVPGRHLENKSGGMGWLPRSTPEFMDWLIEGFK